MTMLLLCADEGILLMLELDDLRDAAWLHLKGHWYGDH